MAGKTIVLPPICERKNMSDKKTIHEILDEMERAYAEDIFAPTTERERQEVNAKYPAFVDRTSAMAVRHLVEGIRAELGAVELQRAADGAESVVIKNTRPYRPRYKWYVPPRR
jgi:hypothetical protein